LKLKKENDVKRLRILVEGPEKILMPKLEHLALTNTGDAMGIKYTFQQVRSKED